MLAKATASTTTTLDKPSSPDEVFEEADAQDATKLARVVGRLLKNVAMLLRERTPRRVDFEDITVSSNGTAVQLSHRFGGRARWSVIGWQSATSGDLVNGLWVNRALLGPGTLTNVLGNFTVGNRFQVSSRQRIYGARFVWGAAVAARTVTATLWRDSDGAVLATGTTTVTNAGLYIALFTTPVELSGSNVGVDLTIGIYDGGTAYPKTGTDAAWNGLLFLTLPGFTVKSGNLFSAGSARPTSNAGTENYWVEPYIAPPAPGLVEDTSATDDNTLTLLSYVPGVVSVRVEKAG